MWGPSSSALKRALIEQYREQDFERRNYMERFEEGGELLESEGETYMEHDLRELQGKFSLEGDYREHDFDGLKQDFERGEAAMTC